MSPEQEIFTKEIIHSLIGTAKASHPEAFFSWLCMGVIGNVVAALPDDYWEQIMKSKGPCGAPNCECHILKDKPIDALNFLRESHKKYAKTSPEESQNESSN